MTGKKQFVVEEVLAATTELFRHRGFASCSIDDIVECTGVARSSLYNAFGSKEDLFLAILTGYCMDMVARLELDPDLAPVDAVRRHLLDLVDTLEGWGRPGGCLVTNTCAEGDSIPEAIRLRCQQALAEQEDQFLRYFRVAQSRGELAVTADMRQLASFFMAVRQSLCSLWRAGEPKEKLASVVGVSVAVL